MRCVVDFVLVAQRVARAGTYLRDPVQVGVDVGCKGTGEGTCDGIGASTRLSLCFRVGQEALELEGRHGGQPCSIVMNFRGGSRFARPRPRQSTQHAAASCWEWLALTLTRTLTLTLTLTRKCGTCDAAGRTDPWLAAGFEPRYATTRLALALASIR